MNLRDLFIRLVIYSFVASFAYYAYLRQSSADHGVNETNYRDKGYIKLQDKYLKYNVYENGEVKTIVDMVTKECNDDITCKATKEFEYVLKLPYQSSTDSRDPSGVINQNGGDCDEKSYLLASLFLETGLESVIVFTKDHAFLGVYIEQANLPKSAAYFEIKGKKFYYVETTAKDAYIGGFNNIFHKSFEMVYSVTEKKEIPLNEITVFPYGDSKTKSY